MLYKVVGVSPVNFTGRDGRQVIGHNIYVTYERNNTQGLVAERIFLGSRLEVVPNVGDEIRLYYNRYGSVESFDIL